MNLTAVTNQGPFSAIKADVAQAALAAPKTPRLDGSRAEFRKAVGEFVGNVFYGTLIKQMQSSSFKTKYMHGGRGEDVFQGQLGIELAQRLGRSANNPIADRMASAMERRLGRKAPGDAAQPANSEIGMGREEAEHE